ncbi:phosphomannomutase/phosphoglucomutase, partial [Alloalcanivorax gelatiniphagus]
TVVAADGATVPAERVLMLLARDLLGRNPGSDVLFDVECSRALATPVRELGGRPVIAPAGATALKARLRESGAPLAGDGEGHICFADRWFGFDDGLYAAARLLEILSLQSGDGARAFADP